MVHAVADQVDDAPTLLMLPGNLSYANYAADLNVANDVPAALLQQIKPFHTKPHLWYNGQVPHRTPQLHSVPQDTSIAVASALFHASCL